MTVNNKDKYTKQSKITTLTLVNDFINNRICPHGCELELDVFDDKVSFLDDLEHHVIFCSKRFNWFCIKIVNYNRLTIL